MSTNPNCRTLTEFSLPPEVDMPPQAREALAGAVAEFDLPSGFLDRLQVSLINAWQKHQARHGPGAAHHPPVQVRLCVTGVPGPGQGWGYYVVEKFEGESGQHRVEVFLYTEAHPAAGDRPPP